jgi:hypothetical protein
MDKCGFAGRYNAVVKTLTDRGIWVAPAVALVIGVWAEFADLTPPVLLAIALPAMAVTLAAVAVRYDLGSRPIVLIVAATAIGLLTFAIAEGLYLAIHYGRGGTLDFESIDSQPAMAAALFGIHVAVGALAGFGLGVVSALLTVVWRLRAKDVKVAPARAIES